MDYNIIYHIATIVSLGFLFIEAKPIILLKRLLGFKEEEHSEYNSLFKVLFHELIYCQICTTFWIGIFFSLLLQQYNIIDIISIASISSYITYLITKNDLK
jgi:hypothetical protein